MNETAGESPARPRRKAQAKPALRLIGLGESSALEHRLDDAQVSIGSGRESDLVIEHTTVSRRHAIVRQKFARLTITDLESTNGTIVNRRRIKRPAPIRAGDEIRFGAARFAVLGGAGAARVRRRRQSIPRRIGASIGIAMFAIAGFLLTQYVLNWNRIDMSPAGPAQVAPAPANANRGPSLASAASAAQASSSGAPPSPLGADVDSASPAWLRHLNQFRSAENLPLLRADPKLSDGAHKHAIYLLRNSTAALMSGRSLGANVHSEDKSSQWYTPEGADAAGDSDVAERGSSPGSKLPDPQTWAIDGWMAAPLHRLFILDPKLHTAGYGDYCENNICVALLNVVHGADPLPRTPAPLVHPILFPPQGGTIPASMRSMETEWPSPISGCNGYAFPTGIPVTVQLGAMVDAQLNSFAVTRDNSAKIAACGFDASSYCNPMGSDRTRVMNTLRQHGAIVIVPQKPLEPGARYNVLATVNGHDYKWSFGVARH